MWDEPLKFALAAGAAGVLLELVGAIAHTRLVRLVCYGGMAVMTIFALTLLVISHLTPVTGLVVFIGLYRVINAVRVVSRRMREPRLRHASRRTSALLLFLQALSLLLWGADRMYNITGWLVLYILVIGALITNGVLAFSTMRNLRRMSIRLKDTYVDDADLPTVSICIPARNETEELPVCLHSVLESDYPKLEVLVLDDCSQDRTSEIIKKFAQSGVRFIKGEPPRDNWLAKNQAYQALAEAASGEILLFCGVDTRFSKSAVRTLVSGMAQRKKQMVSVLPRGVQSSHHASLVQPMRYWWELVPPRRLFNRPPVLSTVWVITRQAFFGRGEMHAVKNSILPEGYFARELTKSDEYSFLRAGGALSIWTAKNLEEQWQTAVRTRYPRLRKRPENVLMTLLIELWLFVLPMTLVVIGFIMPLGLLWLLAAAATLVLFYIHWRVLHAWMGQRGFVQLPLLPVAILVEMFVLQYSMYCYEFSEVHWKDRNICIPVMRHYKSLPKI